MKSLMKILIGTLIPMISQASPFAGEWTCTIEGKSAIHLSIEALPEAGPASALKLSPALSLAHNHKGVLILNSEKTREQKDFFPDDEGSVNNGMFNYIRNFDSVKLTKNLLEISSLETYLRTDVNEGVESKEILQNQEHEVMQLELLSPLNMQIREYGARGKKATPKLITIRECTKR
jgi:hypothetical protein